MPDRIRYFVPDDPSDPLPPIEGPKAHHVPRLAPYSLSGVVQPLWYEDFGNAHARPILNYSKVAGNPPPAMQESTEYIDPRLYRVRVRYPRDQYPESESYGKHF